MMYIRQQVAICENATIIQALSGNGTSQLINKNVPAKRVNGRMNSVFMYSDYRQYMADYIEEQKRVRYGFSYQFFANQAGFKARDFIYRVVKGEKNLSSKSALQIASAMGLVKKEAEFFHTLVEFNQADSTDRKMHFYQKMVEIKQVSRKAPTMALLADDQVEYVSKWYHAVVRSIIGITDFRGNYKKLASMIIPEISAIQAKKSVELLIRLGLIFLDEQGRYQIVNATVSTGPEFQSIALQTFYRDCFGLAERSMNQIDRSERNITGVTLGLSERSYQLMVERLNDLRKEFLFLAEDDNEADRVYNLTLALFPMAKAKIEEVQS